jgi:hypothetical protein
VEVKLHSLLILALDGSVNETFVEYRIIRFFVKLDGSAVGIFSKLKQVYGDDVIGRPRDLQELEWA